MKKTLIYLIFAVFLALIVQPNIRGNLSQGDQRVPTNTTNGTPATNDTIELKADVKDITICVDAAQQSGSDQDINLAMAEAIGKKLEDSGFQVVYTRQDTTTLSNDERLSLARNDKADYLLSITTTNDTDTLQKGFSIMTQQNTNLINLGSDIAEELESVNYTDYQGLDSDHYENFPILTNTNMPAILLEVGYTSNTEDVSALTNEATQDKIATAIARGFVLHISQEKDS
ncbi:N-acetylmuramoyl-L-alanine amidase [Absicoccus porci]|uniref:N-acetylmuramoyl-L-alanine amidase n=1 Tax=Absicoccus porci TaxID=2486576 RepID=UPI0029428F00|nr:N-acetylmuramoyl-L-alanine amidase [Absicoccus porci]MEE1354670.1 N-acetylmuramoyl-L-alanine amidase [Absicoccus porci]